VGLGSGEDCPPWRRLAMSSSPSSGPRGCGGVGCAAFFGNEDKPDRTNWSFVGEGRGGYEKVETLVWVGEGNGTYDREEQLRPQAKGGGYRRLYMSIMVMLVLAGAVCLLASIATGPKRPPQSSTREEQDMDVSQAAPTARPHASATEKPQPKVVKPKPQVSKGSMQLDCSLSQKPLSNAHKMWCCANKGAMCPQLDCEAGYDDWAEGWSTGKKIWCCKHFHRGCEAEKDRTLVQAMGPGSDRHRFDCQDSVAGLRPQAWSQVQRDWCCWHYGSGCPSARSIA